MKAHKNEDMPMNSEDFIQYERRLTKTEVIQEHLLETLIEIKSSIKDLDKKIDSNFKYLLFWTISGFVSVLGVIAKTSGWI
jgi:hypothetical protein